MIADMLLAHAAGAAQRRQVAMVYLPWRPYHCLLVIDLAKMVEMTGPWEIQVELERLACFEGAVEV